MKDNTILILGGESRLANGFQRLFPKEITRLSKKECTILDIQSLEKAFKKYTNKYILNCAAITDIEYCEKNPKDCFELNSVGPYLLNQACQKFGRKLIHLSSDYAETKRNIYGLSKYVSEQIVNHNTLIIRTNFYDEQTYIVKKLSENNTIDSYTNVFFNPISINRLVTEIVTNKNKTGLLNIFTSKKISYFKFASEFCHVFERNKQLIKKTIYEYKENYTPRPLSSYVKPDITVHIEDDLNEFKKYIEHDYR